MGYTHFHRIICFTKWLIIGFLAVKSSCNTMKLLREYLYELDIHVAIPMGLKNMALDEKESEIFLIQCHLINKCMQTGQIQERMPVS